MTQTTETTLSISALIVRGIKTAQERTEVASRVASFAEELDVQGLLSKNWWNEMIAGRPSKDGTADEILLSALAYLDFEDRMASTILNDLSSS